MACYTLLKKDIDIEDFYGDENDHIKEDIKNNLEQYKQICKNLIEFSNNNKSNENLKVKFQKRN